MQGASKTYRGKAASVPRAPKSAASSRAANPAAEWKTHLSSHGSAPRYGRMILKIETGVAVGINVTKLRELLNPFSNFQSDAVTFVLTKAPASNERMSQVTFQVQSFENIKETQEKEYMILGEITGKQSNGPNIKAILVIKGRETHLYTESESKFKQVSEEFNAMRDVVLQ